jgi:exopolyphosphatase/guanosine-5'-triphosphate,3'-diphosphate pyrophosphatase
MAVQRCGVIDTGSNTVKLLVVDVQDDGTLTRVVEFARTARLGEGMNHQRIQETAIRRTLDAYSEMVTECQRLGVGQVFTVGTSAMRDAVNQDEIVSRAAERGVKLEVISGEEEARLSYTAVRHDPRWKNAPSLAVIDVGGGSTEIILGTSQVDKRTSFQLGAVRLTDAALRGDPPTVQEVANARRIATETLEGFGSAPSNTEAVAVGGTIVNLAAVQACGELTPGTPEFEAASLRSPEQLHGSVLSAEQLDDQAAWFASSNVERRKQVVGLSPDRADIILAGALIFCHALGTLGLDHVSVSCRGLRWGVLYDRLGI